MNINAEIATLREVTQYKKAPLLKKRARNWFMRKAYKVHQFISPYNHGGQINEKYEGVFDPRILNIQQSAFLVGYWQSEKYFKTIEAIIRQDFSPSIFFLKK